MMIFKILIFIRIKISHIKQQPVQLNDLNLPIEKMQSSQGTERENLHLFHKYKFHRSLMQLQKSSWGKIETVFIIDHRAQGILFYIQDFETISQKQAIWAVWFWWKTFIIYFPLWNSELISLVIYQLLPLNFVCPLMPPKNNMECVCNFACEIQPYNGLSL